MESGMCDHHYSYEVRNQDPVQYIDRVLLAELMVRDQPLPSGHLTRFKAGLLTLLIVLAALGALVVPLSQRSPSVAQEADAPGCPHVHNHAVVIARTLGSSAYPN